MNQIACSKKVNKHIHPLLAALDDQDANQRRLRVLVHRFHSGRRPLFRCLGMKRVDGVMYEAVPIHM